MTHYTMTIDAVGTNGAQPLRKRARLARRLREARALDVSLPVYLKIRRLDLPTKREVIVMARLAKRDAVTAQSLFAEFRRKLTKAHDARIVHNAARPPYPGHPSSRQGAF